MNNNKTIFISNGKVVSKDNSNNTSILFNNIADPTTNIPNGGIDGFRNGANGASSCTECGGPIGSGTCQPCEETECRLYSYESNMDDETGDFSTFAIGSCGKSNTTITSLGLVNGQETWRYETLVTITCECLASFESGTGPLRGPDSTNPGEPISYVIVPCPS